MRHLAALVCVVASGVLAGINFVAVSTGGDPQTAGTPWSWFAVDCCSPLAGFSKDWEIETTLTTRRLHFAPLNRVSLRGVLLILVGSGSVNESV